ncbi:MAG: hypothetical protein Q4C65_03860 [Eubacteriales bacterium]|nr:hypothetical protein [Eubacteriales bacterium]
MTSKQHCLEELARRHLFLSSLHYIRFSELYDDIEEMPFFCPALVKVIFIAAWIQDLHDKFLEDLEISIDSDCQDTSCLERLMKKRMSQLPPDETVLYEIVLAFLEHPGETPHDDCLLHLSQLWLPIADNALSASMVIDHLEEEGIG